ncbi:MAG: serine hydrolase [Candidatus Daviesbacteria bacterium]|nr:MAG: serine hydrolase [Candidatus Daviesbacteria bacterium]
MPKQPWGIRIALYTVIILVSFLALFKLNIFSSEATFIFNFKDKSLSTIFNSTPKTKGTYSFYVESLLSGEKYGYQENTPMPAASLYKLYLLAAVFKETEDGRLKTEDKLSAPKDYLIKRFGSVDFGYENAPGTISYSVEEALVRVGRISDNFAAIMLTDKVGVDKIAQMAAALGAKNTRFDQDSITTSAFDIAEYFKALYRREIISPEVSDKIIKLLQTSVIKDRIPAQLPGNVRVIHKTGELARIRHDAGLVYLNSSEVDEGAYVIVMMSKDLQREDEGVETLAQLSKRFYDYFSSRLD